MPADLDQFWRENSHGAVVGGKGLVELGHMPADAGALFHQVDFESGCGKVQGGLDAADSPAHNQDVAKIFVAKTRCKLLYDFRRQYFVFHCLSPLYASGLYGPLMRYSLNQVADDFGDVFDLDLIFIGKVQAAFFKIGDAVRAGGGQDLGPCFPCLFEPNV